MSCSLHRLMAHGGWGAPTYPHPALHVSRPLGAPGPCGTSWIPGTTERPAPRHPCSLQIEERWGTSSPRHSRVLPIAACESQLEVWRFQPNETAQGSDGHARERRLCTGGLRKFKKTEKVLAPRLAMGACDAGQPLSPLSSFWHWTLKS